MHNTHIWTQCGQNVLARIRYLLNFSQKRRAAPRNNAMRNLYYREKMPVVSTVTAIAEGCWNGIVVSGVLAVSALLIKSISTFYFN
jgi:hypothetical protein